VSLERAENLCIYVKRLFAEFIMSEAEWLRVTWRE